MRKLMLLAPSVVIMKISSNLSLKMIFVAILVAFQPLRPYLRPNPEFFSLRQRCYTKAADKNIKLKIYVYFCSLSSLFIDWPMWQLNTSVKCDENGTVNTGATQNLIFHLSESCHEIISVSKPYHVYRPTFDIFINPGLGL